jgi:FkbM family methyltransferase
MANLFPLLRRGIEKLGYEPQMFPPIRLSRRLFRSVGVDVEPFGPRSIPWQLRRLFRTRAIGTILDVGANRGQFGLSMRDLGFGGVIHSFEPVPEVFQALQKTATRDRNWHPHPLAIGAVRERATFNVGRFDQTSSLKRVAAEQAVTHKVLEVAREIEVEVDTLDHFLRTERLPLNDILLKIDVQGAELDVLEGARESFPGMRAIYCETSFEKTYIGEADFVTLIERLQAHGFRLNGVAPVYFHPERMSIMQVDALLVRP